MKKVPITAHAALRYLERIEHVNINQYRDVFKEYEEDTETKVLEFLISEKIVDINNLYDKILPDRLNRACQLGDGDYSLTSSKHVVRVYNGVIITVLPNDRVMKCQQTIRHDKRNRYEDEEDEDE